MATNIISVAGLVGSHLTVTSDHHTSTRAGRIVDLVMRHGSADRYPEITGFVVRFGRPTRFVPTDVVIGLDTLGRKNTGRPGLRTRIADLSEFARRESDVLLAADVLDRQIIDSDGIHVIRAADLYLAMIGGAIRLIALDTSIRTLIRRLGPRRMRTRPAAHRVIDWSHVDGYSLDGRSAGGSSAGGSSADSHSADGHCVDGGSVRTVNGQTDALKLCAPHATLTRMRAGELASRVHELSGSPS